MEEGPRLRRTVGRPMALMVDPRIAFHPSPKGGAGGGGGTKGRLRSGRYAAVGETRHGRGTRAVTRRGVVRLRHVQRPSNGAWRVRFAFM